MQVSDFLRDDELVQLPYVMGAWGAGIFGNIVLNKMELGKSKHSQFVERAAHYTVLLSIILVNMYFDTANPDISFSFMTLKGIIGGYLIGVLDFYFSPLKYVSVLESVFGVCVWLTSYYLTSEACTYFYGDFVSVTTFDNVEWYSPFSAYARFFLLMFLTGPINELTFNPLHRLQHASSSYSTSHKHHHNFTTELCGLAFYSGTFVDDMLMGLATGVGLTMHFGLFNYFGLLGGYMCTPVYYTAWSVSTYAHSHNKDLSTLVLPIPEDKNFVTYHRQHHLDPNCNMGFSEAGDRFWDWVLGQNTVKKCE